MQGGCRETSRSPRRADGTQEIRIEAGGKGTCTIRLTTSSESPVPVVLEVERAGGGKPGKTASVACGAADKAYRSVPLAAIRARPARWEGRRVKLAGRATVVGIACTAMACPGKGCCNACGATMVFRGSPRTLRDGSVDPRHIRLEGLRCGGNECTVRDGCPFRNGGRITAWGTWKGADSDRELAVEGACGGF